MNKKNLGNQHNDSQKIENNKTSNYHRCSSVENKFNSPFFSKDLEKEYLDIKHLVKNSVEKINVLFNNEEFKQKTSKKLFQNNINKININKFNLNKQDTSFDLLKKEEEKTDNIISDNNIGKAIINDIKINNSFLDDDEDYKYNSNDLYQELKDLSNHRVKNNKNISKFFQPKKSSNTESNNKALLNLESNKLYRNKDQNSKLKQLNISNNTKCDKKQKNGYISNYLKTTKHQDFCRERKVEPMKFIQKNNNNKNKIKKVERNNNTLKPRLTNNSTFVNDKYLEKTNKGEKSLNKKYKNTTFKKDNSFYKKSKHNNSMSIDMDLNLNNNDNTSSQLNFNVLRNNKKEKEKIILSINKHLYRGEKRDIIKLNTNLTLPSLHKESPSKFINIANSKKKFEKISTNNFLKMMHLLSKYLINNNLIEDYSKPDNKRIMDEFSSFLNKNMKLNEKDDKEINIEDIKYGLKTERITKNEKNLLNNIKNDLKNNRDNTSKNKYKNKNLKLNAIFNNIINKYNLILEDNK